MVLDREQWSIVVSESRVSVEGRSHLHYVPSSLHFAIACAMTQVEWGAKEDATLRHAALFSSVPAGAWEARAASPFTLLVRKMELDPAGLEDWWRQVLQ